MDHVFCRMSEKSGCGVSFGTVGSLILNFADDAVIFAETTEVLAESLDSLSEEANRSSGKSSVICWMRLSSQFL